MNSEYYMGLALEQARAAAAGGEVPVGAALVGPRGKVLAVGRNCPIEKNDPSAHAEINVIRAAALILNNYRLTGCDLYVTLEPCLMCAGSLITSRIKRLFYAAADPKTGAVKSLYQVLSDQRLNHQVEVVGGIMAEESSALLREFFRQRRKG